MKKVFNKSDDKPDWQLFLTEFAKYKKPRRPAPDGVPQPEMLYNQAQRASQESSASEDGWRPAELRFLPLEAWVLRVQVLELAAELKTFPVAYRYVLTPALPKDGPPDPLNFRMISIFTALYRVESGAWYRMLCPWMEEWLHPDVFGGIEGREPYEMAWDAQSAI